MTDADAQGDQAVSTAGSVAVSRRRAGLASSKRVTEGNGTTVGIDAGIVIRKPQLQIEPALVAKASFNSMTSKSLNPIPALANTRLDASTGPMPDPWCHANHSGRDDPNSGSSP